MNHLRLSLNEFHQLGCAQLKLLDIITSNQLFNPIILSGVINGLEKARSKPYPKLYGLTLTDGNTVIQAFSESTILESIQDEDSVEVVCLCQPSLGYQNESIDIKANIIHVNSKKLDNNVVDIDYNSIRLKKLKNKQHRFPNRFALTVTIIYSNSSKSCVDGDFKNSLGSQHKGLNFIEKPINLSNSKEIAQNIRETDSDILVIIRGGGDENHLKSFDHDLVLTALKECTAYRITGIGHHHNHNLINIVADYAAISPSEAAAHLKEQIIENAIRYSKEKRLEEQVQALKIEIKHLQDKNKQNMTQSEAITQQLDQLTQNQSSYLNLIRQQNHQQLQRLVKAILFFIVLTLLIIVYYIFFSQ